MEVGCTAAPLVLTYGFLPQRVSVYGVIYLLLLRAKADVASFDRGMLSVSWGAQFSVFFLPVNCIYLCVQLVARVV